MAKDAVDAAAHPPRPAATVRTSITDRVPLLGADGYQARANQRVAAGPPRPACTSRASTTCSAATAAWSTSCSP